MRRTLIVFLMVLMSADGCMMGPDYKRPVIDTPQSFRYGPEEAAETADTEWWKQFNDPALNQLIAEALAHNKSVRIAAANVEQATGMLMTTRQTFSRRQVTALRNIARAFFGKQHFSRADQKPFNSRQILGGVTWEIDLWGRIRRLTEAAQADFLPATRRVGESSFRWSRKWRFRIFNCALLTNSTPSPDARSRPMKIP
jgi:multidrug efflux system outer membrane protein